MSYIDINAYNCTCERCSHTWSTFKLPLTCAKCRSPYWDVPKGTSITAKNMESLYNSILDGPDPTHKPIVLAEKKSVEAPPDKKTELDGLRAIIAAVQSKPKSDYHTKSVLPEWKPPVDQPDYYDSERSVNYD